MRRRVPLIIALALLGGCDLFAQLTGAALQSQVEHTIVRELGWKSHDPDTQLRIQILAPEVRLPDTARLHVAAVHPFGAAGTWLLRMECGRRVECVPFEVRLQMRGGDGSPVGVGSPHAARDGDSLSPPLVRAGQRVQLSEETSAMHLSAPAICLQAGGMGQKIRVRNVSSGRVVLARVRAAGMVTVED